MSALWLLAGIFFGAVAVALVLRARLAAANNVADALRRETERLRAEREGALAEAAQLREELASAREGALKEIAEVRGAATDETAAVRAEFATVREELATARAELRKDREAHAERLREKEAELERLDQRVKAALSEALTGSTKQLVALAKAELGKERVETKREIDAEQKRIGEIFGRVDQTLGKVAGKLEEVERERITSREQLAAQLRTMRESQSELMAGTQALVGALRRPHVRGRWGEVQLLKHHRVCGHVAAR